MIPLNDDVLREVFMYFAKFASLGPKCLFPRCFVVNSAYHKSSIREYPQLCVSKVCSSWRNIALHTPQLWDNIQIWGFTEANLCIAREYLSRAGNWPVSIDISGLGQIQDATWEDLHLPLIDFLSSYRLQDLSFQSRVLHLEHILPRLPEQSVAGLESLCQEVYFPDSLISHSSEEAIDLNNIRYPKLAFACIEGAYKISGFPSSLRIFDGKGLPMTVIECLDFLKHSLLLEDAVLMIAGVYRPVSMPQIHLQYLRDLTLYLESSMDDISFSIFIEALSFPVLEELHIDGQPVTWPATAFQLLAHRSNYFPCLTNCYLEDSESIVYASPLLAPSLKSISICFSFSDSSCEVIFDHISLNGLASGSLAPRLQSLKVGCISNTGSFLDMVESRMKNARMSSNGVPALFTKVVFSTFEEGYDDRVLDMWRRGVPVRILK